VTIHSPLASPRATIDRLAKEGISTRRSLGQHFLIDDGVVGRILRLAAPEVDDLILEVGPGIGTLTEALLRVGTSVTAIEKDERLLPVLEDITSRYSGRFNLICADALDLRESPAFAATLCATKLVANLPYAVAATVVLDCFQNLPSIQSATVMVQREVAERMTAGPGSKDYGAYTVKLQFLAQPCGSFAVSRTSFLPPPRVDSTVVRLDRLSCQPTADELRIGFMLVEAAFAERRKTIRNSMRSHFGANGRDPAQVDALLTAAAILPTVRGETLPVKTYQRLATVFATLTEHSV
jgi:16S rRNA (adenine1518-N6/adenine1519-N6)-dimethyltransferase